MKKIIALLCVLLMLFSLAACSSSNITPNEDNTSPSPDAQTPDNDQDPGEENTGDESYVIGICQFMPHNSLDDATNGFMDAVKEALGDRVTFDVKDAGGDIPTCPTIINGFVSNDVDLILANATPPLQAAASATTTIPILGTSVTDYATALEIDEWTGTVGGNISGTSDLAPIDQQAAVIQEMFPDAENVGVIYCSGEPNSQYQYDVMAGYLTEMGYNCTPYTFTDTNDVASVTQTACDGSDVIYIPTDNIAANNTEAIANIVIPAGIPVVASEASTCAGCGVATLSISYYDLGYATGQMAVKVLTGEADISTMPVEFATQTYKLYNPVNCETLGIPAPEGYTAVDAE